MGLLDDAIREHLELKRRHGADPSEVERQEHEALGPARRSAAPTAESDYDDETPVGALDDEDGPDALYEDDDAEYEDEPPAASTPVGEPEAPVAPPAPAARQERFGREPMEDREEVVDDLEPGDDDDLEPPAAADRATGDEPAESPAGEDVLEETPEFLQETPEHDRLWFEQKPPRDFEF
jgi:hypothetical protein